MVDDEKRLRLAVASHPAEIPGWMSVKWVSRSPTTRPISQAASSSSRVSRVAPIFDLLLLGIELPGISGLDVLTELDRRKLSVLTIMITSCATFETRSGPRTVNLRLFFLHVGPLSLEKRFYPDAPG